MEALEEKLVSARLSMVENHLRRRGIRNERVLSAFAELPRERFLPLVQAEEVYEDHPVPIGHGQTISQPYVVALMIEALNPQPHHRILDVGAGSGYQTAILARLCRHVFALERIDALTESAMAALASVNADNVTLCTRDGSVGWPEEAPFDGIICGAAAPEVPQAWLDQLAEGGRVVVPVGEHVQTLLMLEKRGDRITRRELGDVRFVKLIGRQGFAE